MHEGAHSREAYGISQKAVSHKYDAFNAERWSGENCTVKFSKFGRWYP